MSAALGADAARPRADHGAALGGIHGIEHDEPRIVGKAVGIFVGMLETALERQAGVIGDQIEHLRSRQDFAPTADPVIEQKAEPQHQRRTSRLVDRQHEAQRPDQMRRRAQQHLALAQRLAHQPELALLQVAQAAMDQLRGCRRGAGRKVVLLDEHDLEAAAGGIARDAGAIDAAADDGEVEVSH